MGGKSSTTTQSVSIPPEVLARYNSVNARAESVAQQPFQRYGGEFVAGLTQQQQAGMANTNAAANLAQPYYNSSTAVQSAAYQQGMGQTQQAYQPLAQGQQQGQYYSGRADQGYNTALSSAAPYYEQASRDVSRGLGGVQGYNAAATESAMAAPGMARGMNQYAQNQILNAQGRAQPANTAAMRQAAGAQAMAEPYYDAATRGTMGATQAASPYQDAATLSALEGGQSVSPGELQTAQYMNPYTKSVADSTYQALRQQQQQEMAGQTGNAIRSGAFGGDRAGLAAAALSRQQNLATAQAMSPIYERGYQQALQTAQQQQGVNLSAEQANRAARQQQAQQLLGIGQQGYAQRMGEAQQAAALGQQRYGMNNQTAALLSQLGQSQYQQALGAGQAALGAGQQFYGQGAQQAQLMSGLGGTAYQQQLAAAQQRQAIGQAQQGLYNQYGQAQQGLGQQQFAQGATTAQQQAALARQGYDIGAQTAQQQAALGTGAQNAALQGAQAQIAAGTLEQQTRQADLTANYQQFLQERGYPFQVAQFLANIAMGTGALSGSTTTTTQPSSFFSDERLKENIHPVGETFDGQTIYRYNYKGEPGTQIGLIAQEVERHHPDAVGRAQGFKTVDYDRATEDAARAGLGAASMGGAVYEPGNYARGGYAPGGLVDPNDLQAILKQQQMSFGPFSQAGLYGGKGGEPGGGGYVPKAGLHAPKLMVAGALPRNPDSGLKDAINTIDQLEKTGERYFGEKGILTKEGAVGKMAQRAGILSPSKPAQTAPSAPQKPAEASGVAAGAPAKVEGKGVAPATPAPTQNPASTPAAGVAPSVETTKVADLTEELPTFAARGGLINGRRGYAGLGKVIDPMEIQDPSKGVGAYIEDATEDQTNSELAKPGQAPGQSRGTGSDIKDALGLASSAASLASAAPGAASAAGSGLSALMALLPFSDARLKDNIRPVGKTYDGQNIYAYDFGDGATRMGLIAQEVLDRKPEAVGQSRDGFLTLDYDRATEDAVPGLAPRERAHGGLVPRHAYADGGDAFNRALAQTLKYEGGYTEDTGGPTEQGISSRANPDVDLKRVKEDPAYRDSIYRDRYWNPIVTDQMDPNMQRVAFDTAVNLGVGRAKQLLEQAGNDPAKLLQLRQQHYDDLIANNPEKYGQYGKGWSNRVNDLRASIGADQPAPGAQNASYVDQAKGLASGVKGFWDDNKGIIIPVLRGLGTMASSPSRYAGSAILQGLGAGAQAYADYEKQQADVDQIKAGTPGIALQSAQQGVMEKDGQILFNVNGSWVTQDEYRKMGRPPTTAANIGEYYTKKILGVAPGVAPPPPVPGVSGTTSATGTAANTGVAPTDKQSAPKPTGVLPTLPADFTNPQTVEILPPAKSVAEAEASSIMGKDYRRDREDQLQKNANTIEEARNKELVAQRLKDPLKQLALPLMTLAAEQQITPGGLAPFQTTLVKYFNAAAEKLGLPTIADSGLTQAQLADKALEILTQAKTSELGQHAVSSLERISKGIASKDMTKETYASILANEMVENLKAEHQAAFTRKYGSSGAQALGRDALEAYRKQYPGLDHQFMREKKLIEKMLLEHLPDGGGPMLAYLTGAKKEFNGKIITPEVINQHYGANLSKYFQN